MNFKVKETSFKEEQEQIKELYKQVKIDYADGLSIENIGKKYNITYNRWCNVYVPLLKNDGLYVAKRRYKPKYAVENLHKQRRKDCKTGYTFIYLYYENNKKKTVNSINLKLLEEKVKSKGLEWNIIDKDKYKELLKESEIDIQKNKYKRFSGVKNVSKVKSDNLFLYKYHKLKNDTCSMDLNKLKEKILNKGWEWEVLDKDLARSEGLVI